ATAGSPCWSPTTPCARRWEPPIAPISSTKVRSSGTAAPPSWPPTRRCARSTSARSSACRTALPRADGRGAAARLAAGGGTNMAEEWRSLERSAVLVVDDDDGVRKALTRFLELEGYTVLAAADLTAARALLAGREILVVLADITMPNGESGLDLLAEIK